MKIREKNWKKIIMVSIVSATALGASSVSFGAWGPKFFVQNTRPQRAQTERISTYNAQNTQRNYSAVNQYRMNISNQSRRTNISHSFMSDMNGHNPFP